MRYDLSNLNHRTLLLCHAEFEGDVEYCPICGEPLTTDHKCPEKPEETIAFYAHAPSKIRVPTVIKGRFYVKPAGWKPKV